MTSAPKLGTAELFFRSAVLMNLQPVWDIPDRLFAVSIGGREKYLSRLILERNGVPNIPFEHPATMAMAEKFLELHSDIIAKPLNGSDSRDIHHITHPWQLQGLQIENYILEKYIAGLEVRYLVLNGAVIGVYESSYGTSVDIHRPRTGFTYPSNTWDEALIESSLRIAEILDLNFAAIDYLVEDSNHLHVLAVNTAPGLKWFRAPSSGPAVDIESTRLITESR